jgi:hypothetical protein
VSLQPLLAHVKTLGNATKPFSAGLAELFGSLRDTGGLERLLDFIFLGTGASNGYDSLGHFLRAEGVANICLTYAIVPQSGCSAKLFSTSGASSSSATPANANVAQAAGTSLLMARTLAVVKGATPAQAIAKYPGSISAGEAFPTSGGAGGATSPTLVGGSSAGTTYYAPSSESSGADGMLLNYLLGN